MTNLWQFLRVIEGYYKRLKEKGISGVYVFYSPNGRRKEIRFSLTMEKLPVVIREIPDPAPIKILLDMNFIKNVDLRVNGNGKENVFNIEDP